MGRWKHFSPKRSKLWSISYAISTLDRGTMSAKSRKPVKTPTTERYYDSAGKARFKGTRALKSSQSFDCRIIHQPYSNVKKIYSRAFPITNMFPQCRGPRTYTPAFSARMVKLHCDWFHRTKPQAVLQKVRVSWFNLVIPWLSYSVPWLDLKRCFSPQGGNGHKPSWFDLIDGKHWSLGRCKN